MNIQSIYDIALTTGGTVTVPVDGLLSGSLFPTYKVRVSGTETLVSNFAVSPSGTPVKNSYVEVNWEAHCTASGNTVTVFGQSVPEELLTSDFVAQCLYDGSAWVVVIVADWAATSIVNTSRIEDDAVTESKIASGSVTACKIGSGAVTNAKIGASAVDTTQLKDNAVTTVKITDLNVTTGKLADTSVTTIKIADANVTTAKVADSAITKAKLAKPQRIYSKYSDSGTTAVTSEETLDTYTLTAGYVANDGESIRITVAGKFAATAHTKTLKVKVGSTTYVTNATTTAPNGADFYAQTIITRTGATSAVGNSFMLIDDEAAENVNINKSGITWANANTISVTGQNGTATVNDIVLSMVTIEHIA